MAIIAPPTMHEDTTAPTEAPITDSTMVDDVAANSDPPPVSTIPHSVQISVDVSLLHGSRIFLDICSGSSHPLTTAMLHHECQCFPVDMLIDAKMDLLDNAFYEPFLRICASGIVAYAAASPNCGEYSRLKLRDDGPPALRTPMHLDGVPNLSPAALEKVQNQPYTYGSQCTMFGIGFRFRRTWSS